MATVPQNTPEASETLGDNCITRAVNRAEERIASKNLPARQLENLHAGLDMAFDEYVKMQELKSLAMVEGVLATEEAQQVYSYLGETPEHFNRQPLAVKIVLTQLFQELLERRIAGRRM